MQSQDGHSLLFFKDTATTEIYTLSLHDALPISASAAPWLSAIARNVCLRWARGRARDAARSAGPPDDIGATAPLADLDLDRKSTRLNSSHANISYAVFCLKKKDINVHDRHHD